MTVEDVASINRIIPEGLFEYPPEALEYVRIAKERLPLENDLATYVEQANLNRSANFQLIDSNNPHLDGFPQLTIFDFKQLALPTQTG
ncbi:unnamed protein product [Parnassius apollo]|uniref:(apollo) hypothetical protein n=1 Tax=Parnassius apollo TaxID=110799 RepID=A0A8S3WH60_PARAO|nr:unnamed protein product [Parnassius apollo]